MPYPGYVYARLKKYVVKANEIISADNYFWCDLKIHMRHVKIQLLVKQL
jgi:hypothetical protein